MSEKREIESSDIIAALECASKFVADKADCRHYLHHVLIKNVDRDCHIVASDGHRLVQITLHDHHQVNAGLYQINSVKDAVKVNNDWLLRLADSSVGTYPDYTRLIPTDSGAFDMPVGINASYVAEAMTAYTRLYKKIAGDKYCGIKQVRADSEGANVWRHDFKQTPISVDIVIMPMRL